MTDLRPAPPTEVPASSCRWTCPRSQVADGCFDSDEPLALWGQTRVLQGLDVFALGATRGGSIQGLDVINAGRPGDAGALREALAIRFAGAVELLPAVSVAELRGKGGPGLLASGQVEVLLLDAGHVAQTEGLWMAVREALIFGLSTEVADDGAAPSVHPARAHVVLLGPESARKKLRDIDSAYESAWSERVAFVNDVPRDRGGVGLTAQRLRRLAEEQGIGPITDGALVFLVEELAGRPARRHRVAVRTDRPLRALLTARALQPEGPLSTRSVRRGWADVYWRGGLQEATHRQRMAGRQLAVVTEGTERGVVNGLMVYGNGDAAYCIPGRITARVAVGREGVINIEREAKYSGRSFDKGIYQLAGWLRGTFAGNTHPLGLAASLVFEQSYGKIDGDSATLAEAIALLSELSGLPCRQDLAVTGALTQRGGLLPIGSVNLKVRGWWESCRARGPLTGRQGVLIPAASAPDLQLDRAVLADVRAGRFHIYTAERVEEAAALFLDRAAGTGNRPGAQTVIGLAARRLRKMSERLYPPRKPPADPSKPGKPGKGGKSGKAAKGEKPLGDTAG